MSESDGLHIRRGCASAADVGPSYIYDITPDTDAFPEKMLVAVDTSMFDAASLATFDHTSKLFFSTMSADKVHNQKVSLVVIPVKIDLKALVDKRMERESQRQQENPLYNTAVELEAHSPVRELQGSDPRTRTVDSIETQMTYQAEVFAPSNVATDTGGSRLNRLRRLLERGGDDNS